MRILGLCLVLVLVMCAPVFADAALKNDDASPPRGELATSMTSRASDGSAGALAEVPSGHWSYAAVDALMQRGLVHGYPAGPYTGPTPLTRAEMAGMVARAVRGAGEAMQLQGRRLELLAQAPPVEAAPASPTAQPSEQAPAVTQEDLARIEKLLAEFRNELVKMGVRVGNIANEVAQLKSGLAKTQQAVQRMEQEAARHRISGYTQLRYTVDGSATPESEFLVKQARVILSGPLTQRTAYRLHFDVSGQKESGKSTAQVLEAYAAFKSARGQLLAGQFPVPFGWELHTAISELEAPERALGVQQLFPNQRFDRGVRVEGDLGGKWRAWAAVVNGTGYTRGDTNDRKDVVLRLSRMAPSLEYGFSAYYGEDTQPATATAPSASAARHLAGAHLLGHRGRATLKGEVIAGKVALSGAAAQGAKDVLAWTVFGGYDLRPDTRLGIRYHQFDPNTDRGNDATSQTSLIWSRWIEPALRLRVAEEFVRPQAGGDYEIFTTELQIMY